MSFLTKTMRPAASLPRVFLTQAPRPFTTSIALRRTPVDTAKSGLKTVDRAVADKLVDGIDAAEAAGDKLKQATGAVAGKAEEVKGDAKGKAEEVKGQAMGKASEVKGQAKGKASEVKGKVNEETMKTDGTKVF